MAQDSESDDQLIARSLRDPARFVALFDRHGGVVFAYLARRVGRQSAEDLHADVWLAAFQARDRYDQAVRNALPWLYGIARNVVRAHWRSIRAVPAFPVGPSDPWGDVDERLVAQGRRDALRAALDALDELDRDVLLLVAWELLTPTEVAASLGLPPGTVRWRLHKARAQLRDALGDHDARTDIEKENAQWMR